MFYDRPVTAFASIHGVLYLRNAVNSDNDNPSDSSTTPLVRVVVAFRRAIIEGQSAGGFNPPTITIIGRVASGAQSYGGSLTWRAFDVEVAAVSGRESSLARVK